MSPTTTTWTIARSQGDTFFTPFVPTKRLSISMPIIVVGDFGACKPMAASWASTELDDFDFQVSSFGEDEEGKVYMVSYAGTVYQVVDTPMKFQYIPTLSKSE